MYLTNKRPNIAVFQTSFPSLMMYRPKITSNRRLWPKYLILITDSMVEVDDVMALDALGVVFQIIWSDSCIFGFY